MSWDTGKGFNFRTTPGFVTDAPNDTFVGYTTPMYPTVLTVDGDTFTAGWVTIPGGGTRDRLASNPAELAGFAFQVNSGEAVFRVDLPAPGTYLVSWALGDATSASYAHSAIFDDTTELYRQDYALANLNAFYDATGVMRSAPDWIANNQSAELEFSSTILLIKILEGFGYASVLASFSVVQKGAVSAKTFTLGAISRMLSPIAAASIATFAIAVVSNAQTGGRQASDRAMNPASDPSAPIPNQPFRYLPPRRFDPAPMSGPPSAQFMIEAAAGWLAVVPNTGPGFIVE